MGGGIDAQHFEHEKVIAFLCKEGGIDKQTFYSPHEQVIAFSREEAIACVDPRGGNRRSTWEGIDSQHFTVHVNRQSPITDPGEVVTVQPPLSPYEARDCT